MSESNEIPVAPAEDQKVDGPPPFDVAAVWAAEAALSHEERVARYHCHPDAVVSASSLQPISVTNGLADTEITRKIFLYHGNIVHLECDAIANAANERCLGGGGIDGAIHRAAGRNLYLECKTLNGCPTGHTKITRGYDLPAAHVLHTVGPIGEKEPELRSCYGTLLQLVSEHNLKSVALCCVSSGIFGYPLRAAAHVQIDCVVNWLTTNHANVDQIVLVTFLPREQQVFNELLAQRFPAAASE